MRSGNSGVQLQPAKVGRIGQRGRKVQKEKQEIPCNEKEQKIRARTVRPTESSYQLQPIVPAQVVVTELDAPAEPLEGLGRVLLRDRLAATCGHRCGHVFDLAYAGVHLQRKKN